jgi:hypothetical protein
MACFGGCVHGGLVEEDNGPPSLVIAFHQGPGCFASGPPRAISGYKFNIWEKSVAAIG